MLKTPVRFRYCSAYGLWHVYSPNTLTCISIVRILFLEFVRFRSRKSKSTFCHPMFCLFVAFLVHIGPVVERSAFLVFRYGVVQMSIIFLTNSAALLLHFIQVQLPIEVVDGNVITRFRHTIGNNTHFLNGVWKKRVVGPVTWSVSPAELVKFFRQYFEKSIQSTHLFAPWDRPCLVFHIYFQVSLPFFSIQLFKALCNLP